MSPEELAQRIADKLSPPYSYERRRNLPLQKLKEQYPDRGDWYVRVECRAKATDQAYVVRKMDDGERSISAATFLEIAEAVLEILREDGELTDK